MKKIHKLNFSSQSKWEEFKQTLITGNKDKNVADNWIPKIITVIEGGNLPYYDSKLDTGKPDLDKDRNIINPNNGWTTFATWAVDIITESDFDNSIFKDYYIKVNKPIMAIADKEYKIIDKYI